MQCQMVASHQNLEFAVVKPLEQRIHPRHSPDVSAACSAAGAAAAAAMMLRCCCHRVLLAGGH